MNNYLYELLINDISKIIKKHLNEGLVDGLRDVKIIRHYTTGSALKEILKKGYIEARESEGDYDWKVYNLLDKKVVSFHDARTDPEWDKFIENNNRRISMEGLTASLGLHLKKVCACIEIDFDKLDKSIQDNTHLLNIYGLKAEEFINLWNFNVENADIGENELAKYYGVSLDLIKLLFYTLKNKNNNPDLFNSIKYIWNEYGVRDLYKDEQAKLAWKYIENIFKKHYPHEDLYGIPQDLYNLTHFKEPFITIEFSRHISNIRYSFDYSYYSTEKLYSNLEKKYKEIEKQYNFYKNRKLLQFKPEEIEDFKNAAIKFDVISVVKMLKKHGWRIGDSDISEFKYGGRMTDESGKGYDADIIRWIDTLARSKKRFVNPNIEIRIPTDIILNKENCKIIIFDGICEATNQTYLLNLPKKYYQKYNIEHIK